tara:strand:+ start:87 stop:350 length:264 start_codon:yes stop_codon:yes gene_type:complete
MKVIIFEEEAYHKMLQEIKQIIQEATSPKKEEWINEKEAMQLLGIRGKTKLQQLRDNLDIEFSQYGKIIRYSRSSILMFLEKHRVKF